jgi:hypothetical protein
MMANLSDSQYAATFMSTEKTTKNHSAPPPIAAPIPTKSAVSAASRSQVRALVVKPACVTFIVGYLLSTERLSAPDEQPKVSPASWADAPGSMRPF